MLFIILILLFFVLPIVISIVVEMWRTVKESDSHPEQEETNHSRIKSDTSFSGGNGILHVSDLEEIQQQSSRPVNIDSVGGDSFVRTDQYPPQRPEFY
jgi:hypothetical protein